MTKSSDTFVMCVVGDAWIWEIWEDMQEFILEKDLMFVMIVEDLSRLKQHLKKHYATVHMKDFS